MASAWTAALAPNPLSLGLGGPGGEKARGPAGCFSPFPVLWFGGSRPRSTLESPRSFKILTPGLNLQSDFEPQVRPRTEGFKTPQVILVCCKGQDLQPWPELSPPAGGGTSQGFCFSVWSPGKQSRPRAVALRGSPLHCLWLSALFPSGLCVSHVWTWSPSVFLEVFHSFYASSLIPQFPASARFRRGSLQSQWICLCNSTWRPFFTFKPGRLKGNQPEELSQKGPGHQQHIYFPSEYYQIVGGGLWTQCRVWDLILS